MIDLNSLTTILLATAPAISAIISIIGGFIAVTKQAKNKVSQTEEEYKKKATQTQKDISLIKSKIASIENTLSDKER